MMKYEAPDQTLDLTQIRENQDTSVLQNFNVSVRSRYGSAISYPREVMTMVWKRVKRSGHQASKYSFNISFKELIIDAERKPEKVQIAVMHRRRRYACESRPLEKSFSSDNKFMITWPDLAAADAINFNTTLFKDPSNEQFDNKEWTIIAEEITKKGKTRPLAAVQLNFAFFVNQNPDLKTELKLKLRCLQKDVKNCTLSLILSSTLVKEGNAMDDDIQSQASVSSVKVPVDIPFLSDDNEKITEGVKKITKDFEDWKDEKEIAIKPTPPPVVKQAWGEPSATDEDGRRRHSRNDEPPPPLPPHRISTSSRQSDSFEHDYIPSVSNQHQPQPPQLLPTDRRQSIHTVIKNLPPPPPTPKKDEPLLDWCQRVTAGYKGVKLTDFSRSWRSGLGFCAILHRYDPTLIGDFEQLDFSGSKPGQKENCKIAFDAAKTIGVERALDESEITNYKHPDESKIISYLSSLRAALQGTENVINSDKRKSEYRFSKVYDLSETEKNVMKDLERMRMLRGGGEDETDRMEPTQPINEPIRMTEGKVSTKIRMTSTSIEDEKPKMIERNDEPRPFGRSRRDSIKELEDHQAELERMQDEMKRLADKAVRESSAPTSPTSPPPPAPFEPKLNGSA
uniref:EH domain-binding protein 1 n=1 Tax=Panagrolaimus sp. PS1159 TaxID=55785 RepID=A0AC35EXZ8_9BILA